MSQYKIIFVVMFYQIPIYGVTEYENNNYWFKYKHADNMCEFDYTKDVDLEYIISIISDDEMNNIIKNHSELCKKLKQPFYYGVDESTNVKEEIIQQNDKTIEVADEFADDYKDEDYKDEDYKDEDYKDDEFDDEDKDVEDKDVEDKDVEDKDKSEVVDILNSFKSLMNTLVYKHTIDYSSIIGKYITTIKSNDFINFSVQHKI